MVMANEGEEIAEVQLTELYTRHGRAVLAYALRRTSDPEDAADAVAETFLVAWRRLGAVPREPDARLWLLAVARRMLANQRRGKSRRTALAERLALDAAAAFEPRPLDGEGKALMAALARLDVDDRELLLLIGWEELTPAQAARVLGITPVAARGGGPRPQRQLHRARRRLRAELARGRTHGRESEAKDALRLGEAG
jgi:RNA polymerase sigma factor (sigma-70 family)